jgi:hypothetical protein
MLRRLPFRGTRSPAVPRACSWTHSRHRLVASFSSLADVGDGERPPKPRAKNIMIPNVNSILKTVESAKEPELVKEQWMEVGKGVCALLARARRICHGRRIDPSERVFLPRRSVRYIWQGTSTSWPSSRSCTPTNPARSCSCSGTGEEQERGGGGVALTRACMRCGCNNPAACLPWVGGRTRGRGTPLLC